MKAAPGATLPPDQILGRDRYIRKIWDKLEHTSVRLEAERRIGKTSVLHKMEAEAPPRWETVAVDLEKVHSAAEFAEKVCDEVLKHLRGWKREGRRLKGLLSNLGGVEVAQVKLPSRQDQEPVDWKRLLISSIEDLVEQQAEASKRTVFLFDEMPWMLEAIADPSRDGAQTSMEILDVLRGLRQDRTTGQGFRMVICGSVGMHHVLANLKAKGYRNEPVNDMQFFEVPPLELEVSVNLAACLLEGEGINAEPGAAQLIAEQAGGFPYYVHYAVAELVNDDATGTPACIKQAFLKLLASDQDPCDFEHFKTRLKGYYQEEEKIVIALLDHAAVHQAFLSPTDFINVGKLAGATDEDRVCELLRLLSVDHYLEKSLEDGKYRFRHPLLRRWWIIKRRLNPSQTL